MSSLASRPRSGPGPVRVGPRIYPWLLAILLAILLGTSCGGSALRPHDGSADVDDPAAGGNGGAPDDPDAGGAGDANSDDDAGESDPDLGDPDADDAASSDDGPADADPDDTGAPDAGDAAEGDDTSAADGGDDTAPRDAEIEAPPVVTSCGGVTCPALFTLTNSCRPMGACTRRDHPAGAALCYESGVRVHTRIVLGPAPFVIDVSKPDGVSPCYYLEMGLPPPGGGARTVNIRRPDGSEIARAAVTPNGGPIYISCDGVAAELSDHSCLPLEAASRGCAAGACD